jgi:hypothetical protein
MTIAPSLPLVHGYQGANPYEIIPSKWGNLPHWHVNANLTGEMKDYERVRNDAIEAEAKLADIEAREKAMLAEHLALNAERAAFDAERRAFADQAAALAGRLSVEWDRIEKLRADQIEEPLASPPGTDPDNPNKLPEPSLELEGDNISGASPGNASPGDPSEDPTKEAVTRDQTEFPSPELPHPPEVQQPIAVGLDDKE